jgi:ribosomal RNA-processing protein 12
MHCPSTWSLRIGQFIRGFDVQISFTHPLCCDTRQAGREPRAFLLPLLAQPHPSLLQHFVSYFVPLSERMFNLQQSSESEKRQSEAKLWTVLIAQIWAGLPGYCWAKADTQEVAKPFRSQTLFLNLLIILPSTQAFTPAFSQMLSQILYTQVELRSFVLRALSILVDSNVAVASQDRYLLKKLPSTVRMDSISQDQAAKNVDFLRNQAESWLAVLFNVFGSIGREAQGMVGEVITTWLGIAGETVRFALILASLFDLSSRQAVTQGYRKVFGLFSQNLKNSRDARGSIETSSTVSMTLDILVLLLPYLSTQDASELFDAIFSKEVLVNPDNAVQKRAYKILARLVEGGKLPIDVERLFKQLDGLSDGLSAAAKKVILTISCNLECNSHGLHAPHRIDYNYMRTYFLRSLLQLYMLSHY